MPPDRFKIISQGLFDSKLLYCLQVFGNTWGTSTYDLENRRYRSFTKADNNKLQVLQSRVLRMKSSLPRYTPTELLLKCCSQLSVHQLIAYSSLLTLHKSLSSGEPEYFRKKLNTETRKEQRQENCISGTNMKLSIGRSGFFYRSSTLFNSLPTEIRAPRDHKHFKKKIKPWVVNNIRAKP